MSNCSNAPYFTGRVLHMVPAVNNSVSIQPALKVCISTSYLTHQCIVRPKKPARHTVGILTGRKKTSFSHFCILVIPCLIGTKFATKLPASQESLHTKFEGNRTSHFRDTSCQSFDFILRFFSSFFFLLRVFALAKNCYKCKRILRSP